MRIKRLTWMRKGLIVFGSLEAKIMDIIWTKGRVTIKEVHRMIDDENPISVNAVMTVMTRLVEKEYLIRESTGKGRSKVSHFMPHKQKNNLSQSRHELLLTASLRTLVHLWSKI